MEQHHEISVETKFLNLNELQFGSPIDKEKCITLGDMHGNAYKLLYLLAYHGYLKFNDEDKLRKTLQTLKELYHLEPIHYQASDYDMMQAHIHAIEFQQETSLRLMGDLLADRGMNDLMTLLILKRLIECKVALEIIFSNHDAVFIQAMEAPYAEGQEFNFRFALKTKTRCSAEAINVFLKRDWLKPKELEELLNTCYKPFLKMIGYAKLGDKEVVFTHAPCDRLQLNVLVQFCIGNQFIPEDVRNAQLIQQIDAVNGFFTRRLEMGNLSSLLCQKKAYRQGRKKYRAFSIVFDSRCTDELFYEEHEQTLYVCGHALPTEVHRQRLNRHVFLDNYLGKYAVVVHEHPFVKSAESLVKPGVSETVQSVSADRTPIERSASSRSQRKPTPIRTRFFTESCPELPSYCDYRLANGV